MFSLLAFIFNVQFWSNLVTAIIRSIPAVIEVVSTVIVGLWHLSTWYFKKLALGIKQTWLTPVVIALWPLLVAGTVLTTHDYIKDRTVLELRKDYRFVPRKKSESYQFKMPDGGPLSWITRWL